MDELLITAETELLVADDLAVEQLVVTERELLIETVLELIEPAESPLEVIDATQPALILEVAAQGPPGPAGSSADAPTITFPASASLSGHRAMRLAAGQAAYADSDAPDDAHRVLGISRNAAAPGAPVVIQTGGLMTEPSWSWTADLPIFCGPSGALTQAAPINGFDLVLGVALSATQIHIGAKTPVVLDYAAD